MLGRHKLTARYCARADFVFATRTGRPLQQRDVARALREAQQRATDAAGQPTFSVLHEVDAGGRPVPVPRGVLPSMHSFRHTVASRALLAGESVDEVAFLLGHRDDTVTRTVYVRECSRCSAAGPPPPTDGSRVRGRIRVALDGETVRLSQSGGAIDRRCRRSHAPRVYLPG